MPHKRLSFLDAATVLILIFALYVGTRPGSFLYTMVSRKIEVSHLNKAVASNWDNAVTLAGR
jgi:hypothetical protein